MDRGNAPDFGRLPQQAALQGAEHQVPARTGKPRPCRQADIDHGDLHLRLPGPEPAGTLKRAVELEIHVV